MQIGGNMKKLSTLEMKNISGGGTISGSLFSALAKGFNVFVDMGVVGCKMSVNHLYIKCVVIG